MNKFFAYGLSAVIFLLGAGITYSIISTGSIVPHVSSSYKTPATTAGNGDTVDMSQPATEACPLNGQLYPKSQKSKWESRRPLIIMVENHKEARPQSGLSSADNIYEAVAEGGITRFMTVFYCRDASYVGPVRSARIYFVHLAQGYGSSPLYGHVGGANTSGPADALGEIDDLGWTGHNDLNQFSVPFPNYYRDQDRLPNRATEHTVYTSTQKLWAFAAQSRGLGVTDSKGVKWDKGFQPWKFQDDAKLENRGTTAKISFGFWDNSLASDYTVAWTYNKTTNSYIRDNGGAPHLDKNTGKPLEAKNIVTVFADESPAKDGYEGGHLLYGIIGSGDAIIFQNGNAIKGTWTKEDPESMMRFSDSSGKEIQLVRGQDFIEILPTGNKVTY